MSIYDDIAKIDYEINRLPKGTLTYKTINNKKQPYLQRKVNGKSVSTYIKEADRPIILEQLSKRELLQKEYKRLIAYVKTLEDILKDNPHLAKRPAIGYQDYIEIREHDSLYVDKTAFIGEWWRSEAKVTLITRPRRFGKTLLLSTVKHFFDLKGSKNAMFFDGLNVSKDEEIMALQGGCPVVSVSFGTIKGGLKHFWGNFKYEIYEVFSDFYYLIDSEKIASSDKKIFEFYYSMDYEDISFCEKAIAFLCKLIYQHHGIKPIILIDEYDTPLTESYVHGGWEEMIPFYRNFINLTIKQNKYYEKALITGVAKISKNSLFSDMNNIEVCSCTSKKYRTALGFTQEELDNILVCQNIEEKNKVKQWYDGFSFGGAKNIYNPWSIVCFLSRREFVPYWINTSSNDIIGNLLRGTSTQFKLDMEQLALGQSIHKSIDEDLALQYLDNSDDAVWSLFLSVGYIKADNITFNACTECDVSITNHETRIMFEHQLQKMLDNSGSLCDDFANALVSLNIDKLNIFLSDICILSMSYFDCPTRPSENIAENFYHGLILGLIASLRKRYIITSNRESGLGRYDIVLEPRDKNEKAFIIEFKTKDKTEKSLEETCDRALSQIKEKLYKADLVNRGISDDRIYFYGFGFEKKESLVKVCS